MKTSSGHFLTHRFWRRLRKLLPGTLWARLYSVRERWLSQSFLKVLADAVSDANPSLSENEAGLKQDVETIESLWRGFNAIGKGESGYGTVYGEILRDLPPVSNVLEIGVAGGAHLGLGLRCGQRHQSSALTSTLPQ